MENTYIVVSASFYLAIMIAAFLFVRKQFEKSTKLYRTVVSIFIMTVLTIIFDVLNRLDYGGLINLPFPIFLSTVISGFLLLPAISGVWFLYIVNTVYLKRVPRRYNYFVAGVLTINLILVLISFIPGTNIYFRLEGEVYLRGGLFWLHAVFYAIFYVTTIIVYARYYNTIARSQQLIFFIIFTLPILGSFGQIAYQRVPFLLISNVFSFMVLAMSVQYLQSTTDFLTGLANRRSLSNYLERKISTISAHGFSIIMIDLDNFKKINDTLGHNVGDDALRHVGRFLRSKARDNEFVARFGGDEFIIITDRVHIEELKEYVASLRGELQNSPDNVYGEFAINFSAGYFLYTRETDLSISELIGVIDDRMFKDKRNRESSL